MKFLIILICIFIATPFIYLIIMTILMNHDYKKLLPHDEAPKVGKHKQTKEVKKPDWCTNENECTHFKCLDPEDDYCYYG